MTLPQLLGERIATVDFDHPDDYHGDDMDGIYVGITDFGDDWYWSSVMDYDTVGLCADLETDIGPFPTYEEARENAKACSITSLYESGYDEAAASAANLEA